MFLKYTNLNDKKIFLRFLKIYHIYVFFQKEILKEKMKNMPKSSCLEHWELSPISFITELYTSIKCNASELSFWKTYEKYWFSYLICVKDKKWIIANFNCDQRYYNIYLSLFKEKYICDEEGIEKLIELINFMTVT